MRRVFDQGPPGLEVRVRSPISRAFKDLNIAGSVSSNPQGLKGTDISTETVPSKKIKSTVIEVVPQTVLLSKDKVPPGFNFSSTASPLNPSSAYTGKGGTSNISLSFLAPGTRRKNAGYLALFVIYFGHHEPIVSRERGYPVRNAGCPALFAVVAFVVAFISPITPQCRVSGTKTRVKARKRRIPGTVCLCSGHHEPNRIPKMPGARHCSLLFWPVWVQFGHHGPNDILKMSDARRCLPCFRRYANKSHPENGGCRAFCLLFWS